MKYFNALFIGALLVFSLTAKAQTNPTPHVLSGGDFIFSGFLDGESTAYPAGMQGWRFAAEPAAGFVGSAASDRELAAQSTTSTAGSIKNEGLGGISFLNSGSNHIGTIALSVNTAGVAEAFVAWTAEDIRDGATRENGLILQYRVGESGDFIAIPGSEYLGSPTGLATSQDFSVALPLDAINQPVVQLRWMYYLIAGSGSRDRLKIDGIVVSQEENGGGGPGDQVEITFRVDMSQFAGTIHPAGMHLAGSFPTNMWTPNARPMVNEGNGIWSYTELLDPGLALQYKFVRGPNWVDGDEIMTGLPCSAPTTSNRALTVPDEDTELPAWCYSTCNECSATPNNVEVTFQVDMSNVTINVSSGGTGISGTFNGFAFEQMTLVGNGIYSYTMSLQAGISVEYKFRNGSAEFETPPMPCGSGGFSNRVLIVPEESVTIPVVCYSSCEPCTPLGNFYALTFIVDAFDIVVPDPMGLYIAGTFNAFNPAPMVNAGGSLYTFTAIIEEGSTILWKYLNGQSFDNVEIVPEACGQDDGFEGFNRIFTMPSAITVLNVVCFASCEACAGQPAVYPLVFQVDASNLAAVNPEGLYIAGNFNNWSPVPMQSAGSGVYTFQAIVENGTEVLWKYLNGSSFDGAETVPSTCGTDDGFGGFNRALTMPEQLVVLDIVCFSSCAACTPDGLINQDKNRTPLLIFPNPAKANISMEIPATGMAHIHIFDLSGKMLNSETRFVRSGEVVANVNIPSISGMYIIEMAVDGISYRSKLLVE